MFRVVRTGHVAAMPGRLYEIRFPNGDFEMSASRQHPPPAVGDVIDRRGTLWKVVSRTFDEPFVVRVEPVPDRGKATRSQASGDG